MSQKPPSPPYTKKFCEKQARLWMKEAKALEKLMLGDNSDREQGIIEGSHAAALHNHAQWKGWVIKGGHI